MSLKPPPLKRGDKVRIVAPAGPFPKDAFESGLAVLRERYEPVFDDGLFSRHRYLAGEDDRRLHELIGALEDPDARAVFAARGGFGTLHLIPRIDPKRTPPKLVVGFSDITALHLAWFKAGRATVHGPVVTQLGKLSKASQERLFKVLESPKPAPDVVGKRALVPGVAEGPLVGGNLEVLTRLIGTPFFPSLRGCILLLEDVGERPYRIDRMWTQLLLSGALDGIAGLALGEFTACEEKSASYTALDVIEDLVKPLGRPCVYGLPIGHGKDNQTVPHGVRAQLDADTKTLSFLEPTTDPTSPTVLPELS